MPSVITIQLETILKNRDKSLYWLAKQSGISYNALSKINKNKVKRLEIDTIDRICKELECVPGDLLLYQKAN